MFCQSAPPASRPAPRFTARSMLSLGTELFFAFWMASNSVGLPAGSPPPVRAATSMFLISLANSDDPTVGHSPDDPAEDLYVLPRLLDPRRPDEDRVHRAAGQSVDLHLRLEGVDLPAEGVAPHRDVQPADGHLVGRGAHQPVGQHDHPGAGAVDR